MRLIASSLLLLTSACGTDYTGIYQVTKMSLDPAGCGAGTTTSSGAPYLMVQESSLIGLTVLKVQACTSAEASSCSGGGLFGGSLFNKGLLDSSGEGGVATGTTEGSKCEIIDVATVLVRTDDVLTITAKQYEGSVDSACAATELTSHRSELMCTSQEVVEATRVADAPDGEDNQLTL